MARGYRFGVFEVDATTGELRRRGLKVKLHVQPFQVLFMLLERQGEVLTREEICRALWPEGTFVDYEHGVNSAVNRLRHALGDQANNPRYVETVARRGYRFLAAVERIGEEEAAGTPPAVPGAGILGQVLAAPEDLPKASSLTVRTLFLLLQAMYVGFYVGALANLREVGELVSALPMAGTLFAVTVGTAVLMIPVRAFVVCGVLFRAPGMRKKFLKMWMVLLPVDLLWAFAPFLLLHHLGFGLALAGVSLLVYSPFAQRSLVLMGAGE